MSFLLAFIFVFSNSAYSAEVCNSGLASFKREVHPHLLMKCASCHGDNGFVLRHSASDVNIAYPLARGLVNFSDVENSKFLQKIKQQHWRTYNPNATGMTVDEGRKYLQAWWNSGENICPSNLKAWTPKINLPKPTPRDFIPIQWDLAGGVSIKLEIQRYRDPDGDLPGAYRIKNLRMRSTKQIVYLKGPKLSVSDNLRAEEHFWDEIDTWVLPPPEVSRNQPAPFQMIARGPWIIQSHNSPDYLSIGFLDFRSQSELPKCKGADFFAQTITPLVKARTCLECHDSGSTQAFQFHAEPLMHCLQFRGLGGRGVTGDSPLIDFPTMGINGHRNLWTTDDQTTLQNWLSMN